MVTAERSLRIDHVGIAVADLGAAVAHYQERFGVSPEPPERVPADGVEAVFFELGSSSLELLGSIRADSTVARFLERRGEGLHHLAYQVLDIEAELARWRQLGAELIDERPRLGSRGRLVAFLHPRSEGGVLTELCQVAAPLR